LTMPPIVAEVRETKDGREHHIDQQAVGYPRALIAFSLIRAGWHLQHAGAQTLPVGNSLRTFKLSALDTLDGAARRKMPHNAWRAADVLGVTLLIVTLLLAFAMIGAGVYDLIVEHSIV